MKSNYIQQNVFMNKIHKFLNYMNINVKYNVKLLKNIIISRKQSSYEMYKLRTYQSCRKTYHKNIFNISHFYNRCERLSTIL